MEYQAWLKLVYFFQSLQFKTSSIKYERDRKRLKLVSWHLFDLEGTSPTLNEHLPIGIPCKKPIKTHESSRQKKEVSFGSRLRKNS